MKVRPHESMTCKCAGCRAFDDALVVVAPHMCVPLEGGRLAAWCNHCNGLRPAGSMAPCSRTGAAADAVTVKTVWGTATLTVDRPARIEAIPIAIEYAADIADLPRASR
jgi:hypothetical protein